MHTLSGHHQTKGNASSSNPRTFGGQNEHDAIFERGRDPEEHGMVAESKESHWIAIVVPRYSLWDLPACQSP